MQFSSVGNMWSCTKNALTGLLLSMCRREDSVTKYAVLFRIAYSQNGYFATPDSRPSPTLVKYKTDASLTAHLYLFCQCAGERTRTSMDILRLLLRQVRLPISPPRHAFHSILKLFFSKQVSIRIVVCRREDLVTKYVFFHSFALTIENYSAEPQGH